MADELSSTKSEREIANEECWVLVGQWKGPFCLARKRRPTEGAPTRVEFDHHWVVERDTTFGDIVGFLHTHPSGLLEPSRRDVDTMRAWTSCLGKPLACLIECDSEIAAFSFVDDQCNGQRIEAMQFFDDLVAMFDRRELRDLENVDG